MGTINSVRTGQVKQPLQWVFTPRMLRLSGIALLLSSLVDIGFATDGFSQTSSSEATATTSMDSAQLFDAGLSFEQQKKWRDALNAFSKFTQLNSALSTGWIELARCYLKLKDFGAAEDVLQQAKARFANSPNIVKSSLQMLMLCQGEAGQLEALEQTRKDYVSRFPDATDVKMVQDEIKFYDRDFAETRRREQRESSWSDWNCPFLRPSETPKMPINVYVQPICPINLVKHDNSTGKQSAPIPYSSLAKEALAEWSLATDNKLTFAFVDEPNKAQLWCEWTTDYSEKAHSFANGQMKLDLNEQGLQVSRAMIFLDPQKQMSEQEFYIICLHEIGHALGLAHSSNPADVMYGAARAESVWSSGKPPRLSKGDIERIRRLYVYPQKANEIATQFAEAAYVNKDYNKAYQLLSARLKQDMTPVGFQQTIGKQHSQSWPLSVEVSSCEPLLRRAGMSVVLVGHNGQDKFYYHLAIVGSESKGFWVDDVNRIQMDNSGG